MNNISYKRVSPKALTTQVNKRVRVIGKIKECNDNMVVLDTNDGTIKVGISQDMNVRDIFKVGLYFEIMGELLSANYLMYENSLLLSQNFNLDQYNKTLLLLHECC